MKKPPLFMLILGSVVSIVINVLGLISITQSETKIRLSQYLQDVATFYQDTITNPIRFQLSRLIQTLEDQFDISLEWIPYWFPEYIPIASAFFIGLVVSYCYLENTTPIRFVYSYFSEEIESPFPKNIIDFIGILGAGLLYLILILLLSPILFIVVPVVMVGFVYWVLFIYFHIIIAVLSILLIIFSLVSIVWIFNNKDSYIRFVKSSFQEFKDYLNQAWRKTPIAIGKIKSSLTNENSEFRVVFREGTSYIWQLFFFQYCVAFIIGMIFLVVLAIDSTVIIE